LNAATRVAALLAGALALGACASGPLRRGDDDAARRAEAEARIVELERQAARARVELERLERRVAELEARAGGGTAPRATPAPGARSAPPPPAARPAPAASAPVAQGVIEESDLPEPARDRELPVPAQEAYDRAFALHGAGRYEEAEAAFRAFLDAHAESELADNAWFWIGETRLARGDAGGAAAAYRTAIERHPAGNKVPDALYKLGHALDARGQTDEARAVWEEVASRYPDTAAAERALARLGRR
jgi:tol-pal system protein YbgF